MTFENTVKQTLAPFRKGFRIVSILFFCVVPAAFVIRCDSLLCVSVCVCVRARAVKTRSFGGGGTGSVPFAGGVRPVPRQRPAVASRRRQRRLPQFPVLGLRRQRQPLRHVPAVRRRLRLPPHRARTRTLSRRNHHHHHHHHHIHHHVHHVHHDDRWRPRFSRRQCLCLRFNPNRLASLFRGAGSLFY